MVIMRQGLMENGLVQRIKKRGMYPLTASGKHLLIASIATSYKSETVYNFVVRYNHTYYVGGMVFFEG